VTYLLAQIVKYLIGLAGITIVVLIHEFGHYLAARLNNIDVEVFSFGFGPALLSKQLGDVEVRLSLFPVGGYCRLKGSDDLRRSLKEGKDHLIEDGSLFAATNLQRLITYLGGPLFSLLFAFLMYTILAFMPFEVLATDAIVTPVTAYPELFGSDVTSPAYEAGIRINDRIIALDGETIDTWERVEEILPLKESHLITVERHEQSFHYWVEGEANSDGTYRYGLSVIQEPIVGNVRSFSAEKEAGLHKGDRIIISQGTVVHNHLDLLATLNGELSLVTLTVLRDGEEKQITFYPRRGEHGEAIFDFSLLASTKRVKPTTLAFTHGAEQTSKILQQTLASLKALFLRSDGDLRSSVTGVTRSALLIGDITVLGFEQEAKSGLHAFLYLLGVVSISLTVINLLPLPAFDGIQIAIALLGIITRRSITMKTYYILQIAGILFVVVVFIALAGSDVRYLLALRR